MYSTGDDVAAIVLDIGSCGVRCGHAGEDAPRYNYPSTVGVRGNSTCHKFPLNFLVKEEDLAVRRIISFQKQGDKRTPPEEGDENAGSTEADTGVADAKDGGSPLFETATLDEGAVTQALRHIASSQGLGIDWKTTPVLLTEPTRHSRQFRETIFQVLFEQFQVPACYVSKACVLSTFAAGRTSALVLDVGASHVTSAAVQDGFCLQDAVQVYPVGGNFLDNEVQLQLQKRNLVMTPSYAFKKCDKVEGEAPDYLQQDLSRVHETYLSESVSEQLRLLKESHLKVMEDARSENWAFGLRSEPYLLPDGTAVTSEPWMTQVPEGLFRPEQFQQQDTSGFPGLPRMLVDSLRLASEDARKELSAAIAVTGGGSCMSGLSDRLTAALASNDNFGTNLRYKVIASASTMERRYSAWLGGSILGSLGTFSQLWISSAEWTEGGNRVIERKCA